MIEFAEAAFKLSNAHWFLIMCVAGAGYVILWWGLDSHGPAILGLPLMVVGAAFGNQALHHFDIQLADDRIVNSSIGFGLGVFAASFVLVLCLWSTTALMTRNPKKAQR